MSVAGTTVTPAVVSFNDIVQATRLHKMAYTNDVTSRSGLLLIIENINGQAGLLQTVVYITDMASKSGLLQTIEYITDIASKSGCYRL